MKDSKVKRILVAAYEVFYEKRRLFILRTKYRLRIMNSDQTIRYILKHQCSMARFGDGEFDLILQVRDPGFQKCSPELAKKLIGVLENRDERLLVCVPSCFNSVRGCNEHARNFWIYWGRKNDHHKQIVELIRDHTGRDYLFGDTEVTRPYIDWVKNERAKRIFPQLQKLWANRDVLIVEGELTRLGIGNDLFCNTRSIKRILTPAANAFDVYEQIKKTVLEKYNGELVLMALGPTATVLASDLSAYSIQALDIGHVDIEYEWFLRGAKERVAIPGKFTNEAKGGRGFSECRDEKYLNQIIARVGC